MNELAKIHYCLMVPLFEGALLIEYFFEISLYKIDFQEPFSLILVYTLIYNVF
jgi:hypothetical protein